MGGSPRARDALTPRAVVVEARTAGERVTASERQRADTVFELDEHERFAAASPSYGLAVAAAGCLSVLSHEPQMVPNVATAVLMCALALTCGAALAANYLRRFTPFSALRGWQWARFWSLALVALPVYFGKAISMITGDNGVDPESELSSAFTQYSVPPYFSLMFMLQLVGSTPGLPLDLSSALLGWHTFVWATSSVAFSTRPVSGVVIEGTVALGTFGVMVVMRHASARRAFDKAAASGTRRAAPPSPRRRGGTARSLALAEAAATTRSEAPVGTMRPEELQIGSSIGTGAFGHVLRGILHGKEVAIKHMKMDGDEVVARGRRVHFEKVLAEVRSLSRFPHPNVLRFIGACVDDNNLYLVSELAERGSLWDVLHDADVRLSWARRCDMAIQAVRGLEHMSNAGFLHGDVKTPNFLVTRGFTVKVGDFGMLRWAGFSLQGSFSGARSGAGMSADGSDALSGARRPMSPPVMRPTSPVGSDGDRSLTWFQGEDGRGRPAPLNGFVSVRWAAPEVLLGGTAKATVESDIYSFGICMFELLTRTTPYGTGDVSDAAIMFQVARRGLRPTLPRNVLAAAPSAYVNAMERCWAHNPQDRPSWRELTEVLHSVKDCAVESGSTILDSGSTTSDVSARPAGTGRLWRRASDIEPRTRTLIRPRPSDPELHRSESASVPRHISRLGLSEVARRRLSLRSARHGDSTSAASTASWDRAASRGSSDSHNTEHDAAVEGAAFEADAGAAAPSGAASSLHRAVSIAVDAADDDASSVGTAPEPEADLLEWLIDPDNLVMLERLGGGVTGSMHRAEYCGFEVAVKVLAGPGEFTKSAKRRLAAETLVLGRLEHPNVVELVGLRMDLTMVALVMEWMDRGSLFDLLHAQGPITWPQRIALAHNAVSGLAYLHEHNVAHRDIKSPNLLVNRDWVCKLGDFGYSVELPSGSARMTRVGSPAWVAPEVIVGEPYGMAADTYSLGIVLWELITRRPPYAEETDVMEVLNKVVAGGRPPMPHLPESASNPSSPLFVQQSMQKLVEACWSPDPASRPPLSAVLDSLEQLDNIVVASTTSTLVARPPDLPVLHRRRELPNVRSESI